VHRKVKSGCWWSACSSRVAVCTVHRIRTSYTRCPPQTAWCC
jgi:hypothetical protein